MNNMCVNSSIGKILFAWVYIFGLVITLYSCGTGIPPGDTQKNKKLVIDMGSYSVSYPVGDDWSCRTDRFNNSIFFKRDKKLWTGVIKGETIITIYENSIKPGTIPQDEKQAADKYRSIEIENIKARNEYEPEDFLLYDTLFEEKKFYFVSYNYSCDGFLGIGGKITNCILALHFPVNFSITHIFYVFFIEDSKQSDSYMENNSAQLYPVLKSFKLSLNL